MELAFIAISLLLLCGIVGSADSAARVERARTTPWRGIHEEVSTGCLDVAVLIGKIVVLVILVLIVIAAVYAVQ